MRNIIRLFFLLIILSFLLLATASADPAADVTSRCKFYAGSRRSTFSQCKDRNYKTYWRSNNGDSAYIEVISFDKLLSDANKRNQAFFDKLGLPTKI